MTQTFPSTTPTGEDALGGGANLYTRFKVSADITITALRYYAPATVNNVTATLYKGSTVLASKNIATLDAGWNIFTLDTPVTVTAADGQLDVGICVPTSIHYSFVAGLDPLVEGSVYQESGAQFGSSLADPATPVPFAGATPNTTYFGVAFDYDGGTSPLTPLDLTTTRVDDNSIQVAWDDTDPTITAGVTIARAAGVQNLDAEGDAPGEADYDPTGLAGVSVLAEGVTSSPYLDSPLPAPGTYTYWLLRTP